MHPAGRNCQYTALLCGIENFLLRKDLAHIRHRIAHSKCHGFSIMDHMIGLSICSLFKKIRDEECRGSSLRGKNDSVYALVPKEPLINGPYSFRH